MVPRRDASINHLSTLVRAVTAVLVVGIAKGLTDEAIFSSRSSRIAIPTPERRPWLRAVSYCRLARLQVRDASSRETFPRFRVLGPWRESRKPSELLLAAGRRVNCEDSSFAPKALRALN